MSFMFFCKIWIPSIITWDWTKISLTWRNQQIPILCQMMNELFACHLYSVSTCVLPISIPSFSKPFFLGFYGNIQKFIDSTWMLASFMICEWDRNTWFWEAIKRSLRNEYSGGKWRSLRKQKALGLRLLCHWSWLRPCHSCFWGLSCDSFVLFSSSSVFLPFSPQSMIHGWVLCYYDQWVRFLPEFTILVFFQLKTKDYQELDSFESILLCDSHFWTLKCAGGAASDRGRAFCACCNWCTWICFQLGNTVSSPFDSQS